MRNILAILLFTALSCLSSAAQSVPSATREGHQLWAGAEVSLFNPDYVCTTSFPFSCARDRLGVGAIANYTLPAKFSAVGEARWLEWHGNGPTESTYLIGPQYRVWDHRNMALEANVLFGGGRFSNPDVVGSYFVYAGGIQFEKRLSTRFKCFAGYQYQMWPAWQAAPTVNSSSQLVAHNHGISPNGFNVGLMYRAF